jgi:release factor glutamine methyltransferase
MTIRQAINDAAEQLATDDHLRITAMRDAKLLLLHTLNLSRVTLLAHPTLELTTEQQTIYGGAIRRRLNHEPIQYITGEQEFYGLLLNVTPAVLIPRPETEHLVEAVLARLPNDMPLQIADIGTGSGAIAIALAVHLPQAEITALDISSETLAIASANAKKHNVAHRVHLLQSDLLSAISSYKTLSGNGETFDAIVSNPPYIPETDRVVLHPQVRDYEPATALFAGPEGLDLYRRLIPQAHAALIPNGLLALEIGYGQHEAIAALLQTWNEVSFVEDLQQIPRVALARKSAKPVQND